MDKPISFAPSQDLGRYLQSLDSVRFAESDPDACTVQAHVETLISLLFGQTIPIGEHQFLDSEGFLTCAVDLIKSLESVDRKDRPKVETIFPFRLGIRAMYSTIDNLIAEKLGDVGYKLSGWRKLDQMYEDRPKIKEKYLKGEFKFEDDELVPVEDKQAAKELRLVRDRFRGGEQGQILTLYNKPTVSIAGQIGLLRRALDEIVSWTESDLYKQIELQQKLKEDGYELKEAFEPDLLPPSVELIETLKSLRDAGISFDNRSNVRRNTKSREIVPENDKFDGILEIYDSLYNSSIAKAVEAHSEGVSSARNVEDNVYIKAALALSTLAKNKVTSPQSKGKKPLQPSDQETLHWVHDINFGLLENTKEELVLAGMPWEVVWQAYLSPVWKKSVSSLNESLVRWDGLMKKSTRHPQDLLNITYELDDAISYHAEIMAKMVSNSNWKIYKDSKSGELVVQNVPLVLGAATDLAALFVMSRLGVDLSTVLAQALHPAIGVVGGVFASLMLPSAITWHTQGYMRKLFEKIYNPTP